MLCGGPLPYVRRKATVAVAGDGIRAGTRAPTVAAMNRLRLGLPLSLVLLLGLLAVPRVVLHDLDVLHEGTAVNALFVFLPLFVWIVVAARWSGRPFVSLLAVGGVYGVGLGLVHNVLWSRRDLPDGLPVRAAASVSSLFTGLALGALCGALAWLLDRAVRRSR